MENSTRHESRRLKINKFLKVDRLDSATKRKTSKALYKLGDYHSSIPMDKIREVLENHKMVILQEDNTEFAGIFCGREGRSELSFGYKFTATEVNGIPTYIPFENTMIILSWYKMTTCYEITIYLS
jgi:hypothetical protein